MKFSSLALSDNILKAIEDQGYTSPSPIQAQAIPAILDRKDVMAAAQTGTGKTAGFTLPMLEILSKGKKPGSNQARALILTPTRELAAQVGESVQTYGKYLHLKADIVYGGVKINPQMQRLRGGLDVLIATPGRLLDLINQGAVKFDHLEMFVLDEADRMLDMGFIRDINKIIAKLPKQRQNLLFSATFSQDIRALAKKLVNNPVEVSVTPENSTVDKITQWIIPVDKKRKSDLLLRMIKDNDWQQVLVFSRTKHGASRLAKKLIANGVSATSIHGDKRQNARIKALNDFKAGKARVLVATDIAARGIDIELLPHVINLDLPNVAEDYVHRIGRTGRAGKSGEAISLVSADEFGQLKDIEHLIGKLLERKIYDHFEPDHDVPPSSLNPNKVGGNKPKKPKKPKAFGHQSNDRNSGGAKKPRRSSNGGKPSAGKPGQRSRKPSGGSSTGGKPANRSGNR